MTADLSALDRDIDALRQTLASTPPGDPERAQNLIWLGASLLARFFATDDLADLDAAITHLDGALVEIPPAHTSREAHLTNLAAALYIRFQRSGNAADRDRAGAIWTIELGRSGMPPPGDGTPVEQARRARDDGPRHAAPASADELSLPPAGALPPLAGAPAPPGGPPPAPAPADGGSPRRSATAPPQPASDTRLEFAAAYQRAVQRERRYPLLFFVHRPDARDLVRDLIARREAQLGGAPAVSTGQAAHAVASGTTLSIVPNVLGTTFEPASIDVVASDAVRELTFRFAVDSRAPLGPLDGYIDIFVGPLVIGQVPVAFTVGEAAAPSVPKQTTGAQLMEVASASIFDTVFISYSHKDSSVVDLCVRTYQDLGVRVLVDHLDLRSGEDWRAGLETMIRESDTFQLYWSSAAAASQEVASEWRLALNLGKARDRFIRPLYWETPMPPAPDALDHLHFSKFDPKQLRLGAKASSSDKPGFLRRALSAVLGSKSP